MKHRITRKAALACATLILSACSSVNVNLWPFGGDKEQDPSRTPAGANEVFTISEDEAVKVEAQIQRIMDARQKALEQTKPVIINR